METNILFFVKLFKHHVIVTSQLSLAKLGKYMANTSMCCSALGVYDKKYTARITQDNQCITILRYKFQCCV